MLILAIDCATREASVALGRGADLLAVRSASSGSHHAEGLLSEIDQLLVGSRLELADVEAFAVSVGPGGFTSLRIGIATVKGLAFGTSKPVAAVSTLACVAHGAREAGAQGGPLATVLDARRGEVYAAEYAAADCEPILAEGVYGPRELATRLSEGCSLTGEVSEELLEALRAAGRADLAQASGREPSARAAAVAVLGSKLLARGETVAAAQLAPRYLRRPEAEEKRLAVEGSLDTRRNLE